MAEDPKLLLLRKTDPKQVPGKRLPSRYPGRGYSQARLSSSEPLASTVPKTVPKPRSKEPFSSKVPSRNKARRNRFSSKRSQEELVPKQNFQEQLGTLACEPLSGNLAWEPLPSNLAWEAVPGNLAWEPFPGNIAWELFPGTLLVNLFLGTSSWKPCLGTSLLGTRQQQ